MSKVIAVGFTICFDLPPKKKHHTIYLCRGFGNLRYFMGFHGTRRAIFPSFRRLGLPCKNDQSQGCTLGEFCAWEDEEVWCSIVFPCNSLDVYVYIL